MANLTNVVKLTAAQMQQLQTNGYVMIGGVRKNFDANTLYLVEDTASAGVTIESYTIKDTDWT